MSGIRLYVDHPLAPGQAVPLSPDQAHYLTGVMRLGLGAVVHLFNGRDGEWRATLATATRRGAVALCEAATRPLRLPPDLWLLFAPVKKARTDFIVEKAVELGVARLLPVQTRHTNAERIRQDRLQAHAVEAAEQCGATFVPRVEALAPLDRVLRDWPDGRALLWCDEGLVAPAPEPGASPPPRGEGRGVGGPAAAAAPSPAGDGLPPAPAAILIGPEGGFSADEARQLRARPGVTPLALGPRILRADTAAVAAITLWQAARGDWR
jgi:16S rRNA (uracil1498-N3)-methyltransferase